MNLRFVICSVLGLLTFGCVQYDYSQFKSEQQNVVDLKVMYSQALSSCDGLSIGAHKRCTEAIKTEIGKRYEDRKDALMTADKVFQIIATQIAIEYVSSQIKPSEPIKKVKIKNIPPRICTSKLAPYPFSFYTTFVITCIPRS